MMAGSYHQLGILAQDRRGGDVGRAIGWHVKALATRLRLGIRQAANTCAVSPRAAANVAP
jgi:hypothetical protein